MEEAFELSASTLRSAFTLDARRLSVAAN